jgi:hypothetical protein
MARLACARLKTVEPMAMYRWFQVCIGLLCALGFASLLGAVFGSNDQGTFGITFSTRTGAPFSVVAAVAPHSAAERAGIRAGDRLDFVRDVRNRVSLFATAPGDELDVSDGSRHMRLIASADGSAPPIAFIAMIELARLSFLVVGVIVAWRRPQDRAARALAVFLTCFGVGITFDVVAFPAAWVRVALLMFVQTAFFVGTVAALAFACRFPSTPKRGFRAAVDRAIPAIGAVGVVLSVSAIGALLVAPLGLERVALFPFLASYVAAIVGTLLALILGYRESQGADRSRARWALGTIALGMSGLLVFLILAGAGAGSGAPQYLTLTTLVIPFGLAYAILRHQMLDITFVINRAIVYTAVSLVIVGAFILFEWVLGHVVEQNSRTSIVLELCVALVLGLSTRYIHVRVDRFVDNLFFRERHAAEAAVRRFSQEAGLITSVDDLVTKTVEVAQENMRLDGAAFFASSDGGYAALASTIPAAVTIGENDYAVLEMRAWHTPVQLAARRSALTGEIAFPMVVRGALVGFLLCGDKVTHEALAPDERDVLAGLASSAGVALDSLRVRAIQREISDLANDATIPSPLRAKLAAFSPTISFAASA